MHFHVWLMFREGSKCFNGPALGGPVLRFNCTTCKYIPSFDVQPALVLWVNVSVQCMKFQMEMRQFLRPFYER